MIRRIAMSALCGAAIVTTATLWAEPSQSINLLATSSVSEYSGSLSGADLDAILKGEGRLRRIQVLPHVLEVSWKQSISANTLSVQWDSDELNASHYGLEYWDAPSESFKLAFEEMANSTSARTHYFRDIRTQRIRFTVFKHPLKYSSVIIKSLSLHAEPKPGSQ